MLIRLYRNTGEGQNVIISLNDSSLAYGQHSTAGGTILETFANEYGSYARLDNTSAYLGTMSYAHRGVLLTNNRSTVVLQDELSFVKVGSLAWVLHTAASISIDEGGRVAYLTQVGDDGQSYILRLTIVSQRPDFVFEQYDATTPLLSAVLTSTSGEKEYSREGISRLVIQIPSTISFDVAVVFEMVEGYDDDTPVGYSWTTMGEWTPVEHSAGGSGSATVSKRTAPVKEDIVTRAKAASNYIRRNTAFTETLADFYKSITDIGYILKTYPQSSLNTSDLIGAFGDYQDCVEEYEEFRDYVNGSADLLNGMSLALSGIVLEVEEAE